MFKKIAIILFLVLFIPIFTHADPTKLSVAENDITLKIIGTWRKETNEGQVHGVQTMTYSVDKTYKSEGYILIDGVKRLLHDEGTYTINGNKLTYLVSKSNFVPVGYVTYDIIKTINDKEIVYLEASGKEHTLTRIK